MIMYTMYNFTCTGTNDTEYKFTAEEIDGDFKPTADFLFGAFNHVRVENAETGEILYDKYESSDIFVAERYQYDTIYEAITEIGFSNVHKYEVTYR